MKIQIKHIALWVFVLLAGAFIFQVYWVRMYYREQSVRLKLDILSAMREANDQLIYQKGIHSFLSELETMDFSVYNDLLQVKLMEHELIFESFTELIDLKNNRVLACLPQDLPAIRKTDYVAYTFPLDLEDTYAYRLNVKHPGIFLLKQMSGVLIASLWMVLVLVFSYVYLLKIIHKQKTLDEIKSDFVSNMTHELKTPISIAYAANDALLNYGSAIEPDRRDTYLRMSKEQLMHLNNLVEQILTMSAEERKSLELTKEEVGLKDLFLQLRQQYTIHPTKDVQIIVKVNPENLTILADRIHLQHVLCNLIENSIKYSGESVIIVLEAVEKNERIRISVEDNGNGIPQASLSRLFERFYRVPTGDRHDVKGYGLGLYYVKTMVEKHGWTIDVTSKIGKGSIFTIEI